MIYFSYYQSPIGQIKIEADDNKIITVKLMYRQENLKEKENIATIECKRQLEEYFKKKRKKFNIDYELKGTKFQCKVWEELSKIQYGKTMSYKDVAKTIGSEKAVRAVANSIGKNPLLIILPCHRVIGSNGNLTGFSAETELKDGITIKKELLELEK